MSAEDLVKGIGDLTYYYELTYRLIGTFCEEIYDSRIKILNMKMREIG